jgi:membrane protease YdiL (CAAX protease family)
VGSLMMQTLKLRAFFTDNRYTQMLANYNKADGFWALGLFALSLISTTFTVYIVRANSFSFVMLIPQMTINILMVLAVLFIRKQSLESVGIVGRNFFKSGFLGLVLSVPALIFIIPIFFDLDSGFYFIERMLREGSFWEIVFSVFFWFIMVGISEELVFRGFLQTRIYGLFKSHLIAVPLVGAMFAMIHMPAFVIDILAAPEPFILTWPFVRWILLYFVVHILFVALHRKYNSLAAPVILHGFMNLSLVSPTLFRA